jgi:hypothetical protein
MTIDFEERQDAGNTLDAKRSLDVGQSLDAEAMRGGGIPDEVVVVRTPHHELGGNDAESKLSIFEDNGEQTSVAAFVPKSKRRVSPESVKVEKT